jgi:hypothetical protein
MALGAMIIMMPSVLLLTIVLWRETAEIPDDEETNHD